MRRTNQGGSILSFVIIGAVMVLLLVGGIFIARHTFLASDKVATTTTEGSRQELSGSTATNDQSSTKDDTAANDDTTDSSATGTDNSTSNIGQSSADNLPTTGPKDVLLEATMLGGLVALVVAYIRSRRPLASLTY